MKWHVKLNIFNKLHETITIDTVGIICFINRSIKTRIYNIKKIVNYIFQSQIYTFFENQHYFPISDIHIF